MSTNNNKATTTTATTSTSTSAPAGTLARGLLGLLLAGLGLWTLIVLIR